MAIGVGCGLVLGDNAEKLGQIATLVIEVIKFAAVPLLFLAILDTFLKAEFHGVGLLRMLAISALNAIGATAIGLGISNSLQPGRHLALNHFLSHPVPPLKTGALDNPRVIQLLTRSPMIGAIAVSFALGCAYLLVHHGFPQVAMSPAMQRFKQFVARLLGLWLQLIGLVLLLVPWAVFGAVAKVVGQHGLTMVGGLIVYLAVCIGGMLIHIGLVYQTWIRIVAGIPLREFWRAAKEPVIHAFGINSSLATLPLTLKNLRALGVSDAASRLSACIGTNFNNDGILLYEVVAVFFLSQAYGHHMDLSQQLLTALICVAATVGVGGVPEAGIISLSLVLGVVQLPAEGLPILLTVDWIVGRCRSATNVLGDMTVAVGLDSLSRRPHS